MQRDEDKRTDEEKMGACSQGGRELLSSMTKGDIVDEIVSDANMDLKWPHIVIDSTNFHL